MPLEDNDDNFQWDDDDFYQERDFDMNREHDFGYDRYGVDEDGYADR